MFHGGTSSADRGPFVEAAQFVCSLMGSVPISVLVISSTRRCVAANVARELLKQVTGDSLRLDGNLVLFGSPALDAAFVQALRGAAAMVETVPLPVRESRSGRCRLHFLPFVVDDVRGVAVLYEDVTEHQMAVEAFRAAEQRFRLLVDSAADGIIIFRSQLLLYLNPQAVRQFGFETSDELVGRPLVEFVELEHRTSFSVRLGDVQDCNSALPFETAFLRRDGTMFPVECTTSHVNVDDMGAGYLFFRDIAERKRLQARRENARRVDALARLSTSVGVELQSYATELRRWIGRYRSTGHAQNDMTAELCCLAETIATRADAFTMLDHGVPESTYLITLEELLSRVCCNIQADSPSRSLPNPPEATHLREPAHELLVDVEPVPHAVRGDPSRLEAGLTSLARAALTARVNNAPLCIRGARHSTRRGDSHAFYRLSIAGGRLSRTGGSLVPHANSILPPAAMTFGSWEQGSDLEVLGAFATLQAQGCVVEAQPCDGGGLCFDVELRLDTGHAISTDLDATMDNTLPGSADVHSVEDGPPDTERSRAPEINLASRTAAPVLICDDEARLATLTAGLLREFGFEVLTVRNGADAVRAVAQHPVDVVILDVNLPGEDAREIVSRLRARGNVSIILSSGYTEEDIEPALLKDHAVKAFLAKPYGVEALVDTIDQVRQRTANGAKFENDAR